MALGRHTEGRLMLAGGNCERAKGGATSSKSFIGESCASGPMVWDVVELLESGVSMANGWSGIDRAVSLISGVVVVNVDVLVAVQSGNVERNASAQHRMSGRVLVCSEGILGVVKIVFLVRCVGIGLVSLSVGAVQLPCLGRVLGLGLVLLRS